MQPIHNLILIVLLTTVFSSISGYAFVRLRRLQRRLEAHEEAERLANLPADVPPQQRRRLWLVPTIGAVAGAAAWTRSHPAVSGVVLAASVAAVAAALIGPSIARQDATVQPSVAAPTRGPSPTRPPVIAPPGAPPTSSSSTAEPSPDQTTTAVPPSPTQAPSTSTGTPTPTGTPTSTTRTTQTTRTTTAAPSSSVTSAPGKPPDTAGPACLVAFDMQPPPIGLCVP